MTLDEAMNRIADLEWELEQAREAQEKREFLAGQAEVIRQLNRDYGPDWPDGVYIPGCGEYDTRDSRGEKLRYGGKMIDPESGEWIGM